MTDDLCRCGLTPYQCAQVPDRHCAPEKAAMTDDEKHEAAMKAAWKAYFPVLSDADRSRVLADCCRAYHAEMLIHERAAIREAALREAMQEAMQVCEDKSKNFLSPRYAVGQPASSIVERFVCGQIRDAILALIEEGAGDE